MRTEEKKHLREGFRLGWTCEANPKERTDELDLAPRMEASPPNAITKVRPRGQEVRVRALEASAAAEGWILAPERVLRRVTCSCGGDTWASVTSTGTKSCETWP